MCLIEKKKEGNASIILKQLVIIIIINREEKIREYNFGYEAQKHERYRQYIDNLILFMFAFGKHIF